MVKCHHDWNSHIATWEKDGRVFEEPPKPMTPLMEVFALDFLRFDDPDPDRTQLRGTVTLNYHKFRKFYSSVYSSDQFRTVGLGRFDVLTGADFSQGDRPIDAEIDVLIHTALEHKTHGELFLMGPCVYEVLQVMGVDFKQRRNNNHNQKIIWNTGQHGPPDERRSYDTLRRSRLVGPHCDVDVLFAVYQDPVGATVQLTFLDSKKEDSDIDVRVDVCGKVTARNTVLADPDAYCTLFARTTYDFASLLPGDSIPLSKPSVLVPATSSLLLDLDFEYRVPSSSGSFHDFLKSKSSFQVSALQDFQTFVDIICPDADGASVMLKVEVKWLEFEFD